MLGSDMAVRSAGIPGNVMTKDAPVILFVDPNTVGNVTINAPSGRVKLAALSAGITVTNSLCTADSCVTAQLCTNDLTCKSLLCVPGNGSFQIVPLAPPTAQVTALFMLFGNA